jgi:hypothetical protein
MHEVMIKPNKLNAKSTLKNWLIKKKKHLGIEGRIA